MVARVTVKKVGGGAGLWSGMIGSCVVGRENGDSCSSWLLLALPLLS